MIERLMRLLDSEQLSYSGFADLIGVQRSSVSHIMSGRNKPSFDFLQKTLKAMPYLNADWLILGEGSMYDDGRSGNGDRVIPDGVQEKNIKGAEGNVQSGMADATNEGVHGDEAGVVPGNTAGDTVTGASPGGASVDTTEKSSGGSAAQGKRRVKRVILLYDDNSFDSYEAEG